MGKSGALSTLKGIFENNTLQGRHRGYTLSGIGRAAILDASRSRDGLVSRRIRRERAWSRTGPLAEMNEGRVTNRAPPGLWSQLAGYGELPAQAAPSRREC